MMNFKNISGFLRSLMIFSLVTLATVSVYGQGDELKSRLYGAVNSQDLGNGLQGAKIVIFKNGSQFKTISTDNRGKFDFLLDPGATYKIEFQFQDHVTKRLELDTRSVTPESEWGGEFKFDLDLFLDRDGLDASVLNKPIAKLFFNPDIGTIDFDKDYTSSIKAEIERLQKELDEKLAAEAAEKKELEAAYSKAIATADKAMSSGDYLKAKQEYSRAMGYKPDEDYPQTKLEEAQKKYDEAQAAKNQEKEYKEAIESAEFALYENKVKDAIDEFERALSIKPGDKYAKDQVKELQDKLLNEAKAEQTYVMAIEQADQALAAKDYLKAQGEYQKALDAKPGDGYASGQLDQVKAFIAADADKEKNYIKAIERADNAMDIKDYESAKAAFEQAAEIKPEEQYPKTEIAKIDKILKEQAELNAAYAAAIEAGDKAFNGNDFSNAKTSYNEAIKLKPEEKYPKDQLSAIEEKEIALANLNEQYNSIIKEADSRYDIKEYVAAKAEYAKAVELKPTEEYPQKRLEEVTNLLNKMAEQDEAYSAAIQNADNAFNAKDYLSAKIEYESALKIKPDETYPKEQLEIAKTKIAEANQAEEAYATAIEKADAAFDGEDYTTAKTEYETALGLKPDEKHPKDRLADIDKKLVEIENTNNKYNELIAAGDEAMTSEDYDKAKGSYEEATGLKPSEQYPKDQLAKIGDLVAAAETLEADYQAAIEGADKAFDAKDYNTAKSGYEKALTLKAGEDYPTKRVAEIDGILADLAAQDAEYNDLIKQGDDAFAANDFETSKAAYEKSSELKPDEQYPKDKIAEIETKIAAAKEAEEAYAAAIESAEKAEKSNDLPTALSQFKIASDLKPDEQYPKDKINELNELAANAEKLETDYIEAIKIADDALAGKEYDIATTNYQKASDLKPDEQYPKDKLSEIEKIKADEAAAIELANKAQAEYDGHITEGDAAFAANEYEKARKSYEAASGVKPEEQYPKDQLTKINEAIQNLELAAAEAEQLKAKQAEYDGIIKEADKSFEKEAYDEAIAKYEQAKTVLPEESYPEEQITKINQIRADQAAQVELANKELETKYQGLITSADEAFNSANYEKAEADYRAALEVKPDEQYPQDQISKIKTSLADQEAKEKEYNDLIAAADKSFKSKSYEEAKASYQSALVIKPNEAYPTDQIAEVDRLVGEMQNAAAAKAKEEEEKAKREKYDALISTANKSFKSGEYDAAKNDYNAALEVMPGEQYPTDQLAEIDRLVAEQLAQADLAKKEAAAKELQEKYDGLISSADKAFKSKDYEQARTDYQAALEVKPGEQYPQDQLNEVDRLIAEAALAAEQQEKEAAAKELQEKYDGFIAAGDKSLKSKDYEAARTSYQSALDIRPAEEYPQSQIALIDQQIREAEEKANSDRLAAEKAERDKKYKSLINTADKSFKSSEWIAAKDSYKEASELKPEEQYPKDQIAILNEKIDAEMALKKSDEAYNDYISKADAAFNNNDFEKARSNYQNALGIKPEESYPQERLVLVDEALAKLIAERSAEEEARRKEEQRYNNFISQGDNAFESESYEKATQQYKSALGIKPDEAYPQNQINKITELMASKAEDDAAKQERQALLAKYDAQILKGDKSFANKQYNDAINAYRAASGLMPQEEYPKSQLKKINEAIKNQNQVAAKPVVKTPRVKVSGKSEDEIAAMMAEMRRKREQAKLDRVNKLTQDLKENEMSLTASAKTKRESAQVENDEMLAVVDNRQSANQENYIKKVEKVEVYKEQVTESQKVLVDNSQDRRDVAHEKLDELQEEQQIAFKEGNKLHLIGAEKVATTKIELAQQEQERVKLAEEKRTSEENVIITLSKELNKMNEGGEETRLQSVDQLKEFESDLAEERQEIKKDADESREENYSKELELREEIVANQRSGNELHLKSASELEKDIEEIEKAQRDDKEQGDNNREQNYQDIQKYVEETDKLTDEKYNKYNDNNKKVMEKNDEVVEYHQNLSTAADDRRNSYNPDYYTGEAQPRKSANASDYPQGVTEETIEEGNAIIIKRIVVTGETMDEYQKIYYPWGGIFYKKNGASITAEIWDEETK